ncbi:MAG: hypothetical protein VX777_08530 [Chlamydiota bacterium]|nr:hypothetical protein [Chlamydiota bacterium]
MTNPISSQTPASQLNAVNQAQSIDNSVASSDTTNIVVVSSVNSILNMFTSILRGQKFEDNGSQPKFRRSSYKKPFMNKSIKPVNLLMIPTEKITVRKLSNQSIFQSSALNIVLIYDTDHEIPNTYLDSVKKIQARTVFVFDKSIEEIKKRKHLRKISSYISGFSDSISVIQNIALNSLSGESILKKLVMSSGNLDSIEEIEQTEVTCKSIDNFESSSDTTIEASSDTTNIVVVSSVNSILNKFSSILKGKKFEDKGYQPKFNKYLYKKPFMSESIKPVKLLMIPTEEITKRKLLNKSSFQSSALNIVLVYNTDNEIPSTYLDSVKKIQARTVFVFDKSIEQMKKRKHLRKISSYISGFSDSISVIQNIALDSLSGESVLKKLVTSSDNLDSIEEIEQTEVLDVSEDFPKVKFNTYFHSIVTDEQREDTRVYFKKLLLTKCKNFQEKIEKLLGENQTELPLKERCSLKSQEIEEEVYNNAQNSFSQYSEELSRRRDYIEKQCFNIQQPLGKRSREDFERFSNSLEPQKKSTTESRNTIEHSDREVSAIMLQEALLYTCNELEGKIIEILGEKFSEVSLEECCTLKADEFEKNIFNRSEGYVHVYAENYCHYRIKVENHCLNFPTKLENLSETGIKLNGFQELSKLPTPLKKLPTPLKYVWHYSSPGTEVTKAFQGPTAPTIHEDCEKLEKLYRSSDRESEVEVCLDGFVDGKGHSVPVKVDFGNFSITYLGRTLNNSLVRCFKYGATVIPVPKRWVGYQKTLLELVPLDLESEECKFYAEEVKKIHSKANLTKVTQIQNFRHLNNFISQSTSIRSTDNAIGLVVGDIRYEGYEPFYFGSKDILPRDIISDKNGIPTKICHHDPNRNWGEGIHLSNEIFYADKSAFTTLDVEHQRLTKEIFLVTAELGVGRRYSTYATQLKKPPYRGNIEGCRIDYDSISGRYESDKLEADVTAVFKSAQVLPEVLIEYTVPLDN